MAQLVDYLLSMYKALGLIPSTQEVVVGRSEVQSYPQLHIKFETSLDYMRSCYKQINKKNKGESIQMKIPKSMCS